MTDTQSHDRAGSAAGESRLPWAALLALSTAVFLTVLTETLPAGVLPAMSDDLGVSESAMGQAVTVYALGTALTAIPLAAATVTWRRKRLLLVAMAAFAAANTVTALSTDYPLTLAARFAAGMAAGVAWAMMVGYARRLAPARLQGRAIAVVMAGVPVALSLGVPAGTFLGATLGWRTAFGAMTLVALALMLWITALVPDRPGRPKGESTPLLRTLAIPGVVPVLAVTVVFVLAHTIAYTYVAAFLDTLGLVRYTSSVLLVFGAASMASILTTGAFIDRRLRALTLAAVLLVAAAMTVLASSSAHLPLLYLAAALWGLGWGGVPTLLQTAVTDAGGRAGDTAQAILVTLWNAAMAGGGLLGGGLLALAGTDRLHLIVLAMLVPVFIVAVGARRHGFPASRITAMRPSTD